MRVRLLGPVDVVDAAGLPIAIGSPTQRLLLAVLGSRVGEVVPPARLVAAVWGESPPPSAEATLRSYISRLRRVLGGALPTHPGGWSLRLAPEQVDIAVFERLLRLAGLTGPAGLEGLDGLDGAAGPARDTSARLAALDDALALWRGPAFGELTDDPALRPVAARLGAARAAARESRAALLLATGRPAAPAAVAADLTPAGSLPGRAADTAAVCDLLASARLVTVFGPDGVGRTRLALHLADRLAGGFPHGVRLVELATVADPTSVPAFVADALGVRGASCAARAAGDAGADAALAAAAELDALVILDNCDHVVAAAAAVAAALVGNGRGVRVLATSREPLGVAGERCWPVRPLRVDGPDAPAHALFRERVRAARGQPVRGPGDLAAADRIVRRLDGLPLGLELVAARSGTTSLPELGAGLDDHFGPLRDARRVGTPRHRALTDVVGWSVSLLDAPHRAMLRTLGVFAGPVGPADVAALAGVPEPETRELLDALVARSLVVVDPSRAPTRYSLLETVRGYARRRLGASDTALRQAHARYVLAEVRAADAVLRTAREAAGHSRITDLMVEAHAAQTWALGEDPPLAVEIAAGLHVFAVSRLRVEPLRAAVELVRVLGLHPPPGGEPHRLADLVTDLAVGLPPGVAVGAAATVLATAACWYANAGELELAVACAQRGRLIAADAPERRFPLELLSDTASGQGRIGEAVDHGWELVAAARSCADPHAEVAGLLNVALAHARAGHVEDGRAALSQVPRGPLAPSDLGWLAYGEAELIRDRDPDHCLRLLDRAAALADSVDNPCLGGTARVSAVSVRARCGDPRQAVEAFARALRHWRDQYALTHLLTALRNLVVLFRRLGRPRPAARLLGAVTSPAVRPSHGAQAAMLAATDRWIDDALGHAAATAERAAGATRTLIAATGTALDDLAAITAEIPGG
ncbi:ATP-binding protein [Parafrankia discariae]|uniref:ATP-binding protein n=1 Tax=Parafrankia discariae TaxID=365528 RepID=UPI00047725C7|nr:BTAD domain-containing putative transcriptional regulator [Parafrankia discariae]